MLHYVILAGVYNVDCHDSPVRCIIFCEVHVEVVKKSVLLFQKVSVFRNRMNPLTTKIHEMCNKM